MKAWRALGRGLVVVLHDLIPYEVPQLTAGREVRSYVGDMMGVLAQADRIVAVSEYAARSYLEAEDGRLRGDACITVMHPSVAPTLREAEQGIAPPWLDRSRPFVMFCSTIEVRKNHVLLLNLWERLRQDLPEQALPQLVFVGRWGWGSDAVRLWVERNWRLAPHLRVMEGLQDQGLAWLYRNALFTVFPSHAEGFGMPVAESLACGTPVVTGNHPALLEAAERLMPAIDPLDFPAWEQKIRRLIGDPSYLEELRRRARSYRGTRPGDLGRAVAAAAVQGRAAANITTAACETVAHGVASPPPRPI
jgi:glycosyltransferase involved in cell wall biosynthesis